MWQVISVIFQIIGYGFLGLFCLFFILTITGAYRKFLK
jgi:hypothetical protein